MDFLCNKKYVLLTTYAGMLLTDEERKADNSRVDTDESLTMTIACQVNWLKKLGGIEDIDAFLNSYIFAEIEDLVEKLAVQGAFAFARYERIPGVPDADTAADALGFVYPKRPTQNDMTALAEYLCRQATD